MKTKTFKLPTHPIRGEEQIVIEKPAPSSVWYLIVEPDKSVPLVNLKNPKSAKDVLDAAGQQNGDDFVAQFMLGGYSKPQTCKQCGKLTINNNEFCSPMKTDCMNEYQFDPMRKIEAQARMDGLTATEDQSALIKATKNMLLNLKRDGFKSEEIYEYIYSIIREVKHE